MKLQRVFRRVVAVTATVLILAQAASAADALWEGDTDTVWSNPLNWAGDLAPPSATDNAKFTGTFANQPSLQADTAVSGVWITNLGQILGDTAVTPQTNSILSIGGNTIDSLPNMAVLFNNSSGFDAAINNKISITSPNLVIRNDTDNALSFSSLTNSIGNGVINLNANTLKLSNNGAGSITTANVFGAGGLTIDSLGTGAVVTNSNNTSFSGQLTVARGILQTNSVNSNNFNGKLGQSNLSVILGSSGGNTGTLLYNGATNTVAAATNSGGTKKFTLATGGIGAFDVSPATGTAILTLAGVIDGDGALQVNSSNGNGTLSLTAASTYTGGTTLATGTLLLGSNTAGAIDTGPVGTGTLTLAGGTLTSTSGASRTIANPIVTNGTVLITPGSGASSVLTLTGPLSSTASTDVINTTGSRTLALNGDLSNYGGTINYDRATNNQISFGVQSVNLSKAKLVMNGSTASSGNTIRVGDGASSSDANFKIGELSGNGGVFNPQTNSTSQSYEIGFLDTDATFGGIFHARTNRPVNVTKVGTGSLTLTAANYYFGGTTTVSAGTLIAGMDAISSTTMDGTNPNLSISSNVFMQVGHGLNTGDRIAFTSGSGALATITQYYVHKIDDDTFQVSTDGINPITSGITDQVAGVVSGIQAGAFGGGASAIVLGDGQTASGSPLTATPNVANNSVAILTGGPFTVERAITVTNTGSTGTATIGGNTAEASTFSGNITLGRDVQLAAQGGGTVNVTGDISGGFGVTKVGAGTVSLSGDNGYMGDTRVNEGILSLGAVDILADTSAVRLTSGAMLELNFNETVAGLFFDVAAQVSGTWGATGSGAMNINDSFFSGGGVLTVGAATLMGDYNGDHKVDAADYVVWRKDPSNPNYGGGGSAGYNLWRANFGNPPGSGSGLGETAAVPEPTTLGVLAICMLLGIGRRNVSRR